MKLYVMSEASYHKLRMRSNLRAKELMQSYVQEVDIEPLIDARIQARIRPSEEADDEFNTQAVNLLYKIESIATDGNAEYPWQIAKV